MSVAHEKITVVKLGGDVLQEPALTAVATSVSQAAQERHDVRFVLVHGGGAQVTALCQRLGMATQTIAGRRVTDEATLDVLQMVVAGRLNIALCAALAKSGVRAVGLHAGTGAIHATRRPPRTITGGPPHPVDLGLVGDVQGFDVELLQGLWALQRVPVLSCLGLASDGSVLNVNADLVASRLAIDLNAEAMVAVTGVGGVRTVATDPATRIARLSTKDAHAAITRGDVSGGMIAKLEEACATLEAGVPAVHIVGPDEIATTLSAPGSVGTVLLS